MNSVKRQRWMTVITGLAALMLSVTMFEAIAWSSKPKATAFTLKGEVVAVNTADHPPIVMLRVMTPKGEEMLVGAIVQESTQILKKGKKARVEDLAVGEPLVLTYQKSEIGALAKSLIVP